MVRYLVITIFLSTMFQSNGIWAQPPVVRLESSQTGQSGVVGQQQPPKTKVTSVPQVRSAGTHSQRADGNVQAQTVIAPRQRVYVDPAIHPTRWYLGVRTMRAPKGLRIEKALAGSPAAAKGLEAGDYILDVGGYVVGEHTDGNYYPLGDSLRFGADRDGWVELLIWNVRTYRAETFWVQLARR